MTAAKKKAQRAPDESAEPNSGTLPEGSCDGEPQPDASQPSDQSNPDEDPEGDEPEPEPKKKTAPAPARDEKKKPAASAQPSALARFVQWWTTDLDGE